MVKLGPLGTEDELSLNRRGFDDENPTWTCAHCGKVNPDSALACGAGEWDGCGASRPECKSNLSDQTSCDGGMAVRHFYPESTKGMTYRLVSHPGKLAESFKLELGSRILAAYQKTIKEVLSLC